MNSVLYFFLQTPVTDHFPSTHVLKLVQGGLAVPMALAEGCVQGGG